MLFIKAQYANMRTPQHKRKCEFESNCLSLCLMYLSYKPFCGDLLESVVCGTP